MPRRRIFILNLRNLFFDDLQLKFAALGNRRQLFNKLFQFLKFLFQLEYFELGESCEAQIENSLRLHFRQFETRHQLAAGIGGAFRFFDDCDHFVDIAYRYDQPFEDMAPLFRLVQIEQSTAQDNLLLILDVMADDFHEAELLGLAVGNHHHIDAERDLEIGIFIEIGQQRGNVGVLFDADYCAHARTIGFVCDIIDAGELFLFLLAHFRDLAHKLSFIHLIGKLGDDEVGFAALRLLGRDLRAHGNFASARFIGLNQLVGNDDAARRKIGRGNVFHHFPERNGHT